MIIIKPNQADIKSWNKQEKNLRYFYFTQTIKIDPNFAQAYNNRGNARYLLKDTQGAIDDYTQAIHIDPNYAKAYYNRGLARYLLGDKQSAIKDYTQAIKIDGKLDPEISLAEKEYFTHEGDEDLIKEDEYSQEEIDDLVKKGRWAY